VARIIEERLNIRERAIQEAREFAICASEKLGEITAVLFGSYARGDFNEWSDIDVLVVAKNLPKNPLQRLSLIDECVRRFPRVEVVIVTIEEFTKMRNKNPAIMEATQKGVTLIDGVGLLTERTRSSHSGK